MNCTILLAGGSSRRMEGTVDDKILAQIAGKPVFEYSVEAFASTALFTTICVVYRDPSQKAALSLCAAKYECEELNFIWTAGGESRQESVTNGLTALPDETEFVHIHDCARPLVSPNSIRRTHEIAERDGAAVLAHRVTDTIKRTPSASETALCQLEDLERARLWASETPQAFRYMDILKAHQTVNDNGSRITDDIAAISEIGIPATIVENTEPNLKITTSADLDFLEWLLKK